MIMYRITKEKSHQLSIENCKLYYGIDTKTNGCLSFPSSGTWYSFEELAQNDLKISSVFFKISDEDRLTRAKELKLYLDDMYDIGWIEQKIVVDEVDKMKEKPITENVEKDRVNHPSHYTFGNIEVIDAIEAWKLDFRLANVVKYVARAPHKGQAFEDLKKALWYLARYMKTEYPEDYERDYENIVKSLEKL